MNNLLKIWTNTSTLAPSTNTLKMDSKSFILNDFIPSANLDFMFLTESWLQTNDHRVVFNCESSDVNYVPPALCVPASLMSKTSQISAYCLIFKAYTCLNSPTPMNWLTFLIHS